MTGTHGLPPPLGPGALVLVVGPSGAGKDTVMDAARALLADEKQVAFARRLVTRPPGAGERHGTVSPEAFEAGREAHVFPLSWRAHGLGYALGPEVAQAIRDGRVVVANGSRTVLDEAKARFARLGVVLVTAPQPVRAARLTARGRETPAEIHERLVREPPFHMRPDLHIENDGSAAAAGRRLADFIAATLRAQAAAAP